MLCAWMMVRLIVCRVNWYADSKRNLPLVLGISVSLIVFAAVALSLLVWRRRVRSRSLPLIADRDGTSIP